MKSRRFRAFLSFNIHWYILIFVFVVFVFYYLFMTLNTPSYDEKIVIFIGAKYVDLKIEDDLYEGYEDTLIKEVFVDYSDPSDSNFSIVFSTRATVNTDILILPYDYMKEESYSTFFAEINEELLAFDNELISDSNGNVYGINVTDFLSEYTEISGDFYLFFNKKSNKISSLNGISNNDYALDILKNILEGVEDEKEG